jgi:hypothetical protein
MSLPPMIRSNGVIAWAFFHLIRILEADAGLRTLRPLWRMPDSEQYDDPPPDDRLMLRLVPVLGGAEDVAAVGHGRRLRAYPLTVGVEVTWPKEVWSDVPNLFCRLEDAVFGSDLSRTDRKDFDKEWRRLGVVDRQFNVPPDWSQPGQIVLTIDERV